MTATAIRVSLLTGHLVGKVWQPWQGEVVCQLSCLNTFI